MFKNMNNKNYTLRVLREPLFSLPVAMFFPKNHFLTNEVSSVVSVLHSAGLIDHWIGNYAREMSKTSAVMGPKVLQIDQLAGGIYIYLGGCLIGTIIFLVEKLIKVERKSCC